MEFPSLEDGDLFWSALAIAASTLCLGLMLCARGARPTAEYQPMLTDAQKERLQNWDSVKSEPMQNVSSEESYMDASSRKGEDQHDDLPDLVEATVPGGQIDKTLIDRAISAAIAGPQSADEEHLSVLLERIADPKVNEFVEANSSTSGPCIEMYGRMYAHGDYLKNNGKEMEAQVLHECAQKGFGLMHALAAILSTQNHRKEAVRLFGKVANVRAATIGEKHVDTLSSVMSLAGLFRSIGMLEQCKSLYKRALGAYEETLGPDHTYTLRCKNNLAAMHCEEKKFGDALVLFMEILEKQETLFGGDHKDAVVTVGNLAVVNEKLGDLDKASSTLSVP